MTLPGTVDPDRPGNILRQSKPTCEAAQQRIKQRRARVAQNNPQSLRSRAAEGGGGDRLLPVDLSGRMHPDAGSLTHVLSRTTENCRWRHQRKSNRPAPKAPGTEKETEHSTALRYADHIPFAAGNTTTAVQTATLVGTWPSPPPGLRSPALQASHGMRFPALTSDGRGSGGVGPTAFVRQTERHLSPTCWRSINTGGLQGPEKRGGNPTR
eukprot:gene11373-biopygen315